MPASSSIRPRRGADWSLGHETTGAPSFTSVMPNLIEDPHGLVFEYLDQDEGEFLYEVREDSCHDRVAEFYLESSGSSAETPINCCKFDSNFKLDSQGGDICSF